MDRTLERRRKSLARQPAGEPGGAAGRQHVRRPGRVIAQGHRRVMAQEDRAGVVDPLQRPLPGRGSRCADARAPAGSTQSTASSASRRQHQRAEPLQAVAGQFAARQLGELRVKRRRPPRRAAARAMSPGCCCRATAPPGRSDRPRRNSGGADSSAITTISLGPARQSIATWPKTCFLASVTNMLPGPTIMSTGGNPSTP